MFMKFRALVGSRGWTGEPVVTGGRTGERDSGTQKKVSQAKGDSRRQTRDSQPKVSLECP